MDNRSGAAVPDGDASVGGTRRRAPVVDGGVRQPIVAGTSSIGIKTIREASGRKLTQTLTARARAAIRGIFGNDRRPHFYLPS